VAPRRPSTGEPERAAPPELLLSRLHQPFTPLSRRRRVLVAVLAACVVLVVFLMLLETPGRPARPAAAPGAAPCAPGQAEGCVGSTTRVLPAAASVPAR
jgi:hypothetical protein